MHSNMIVSNRSLEGLLFGTYNCVTLGHRDPTERSGTASFPAGVNHRIRFRPSSFLCRGSFLCTHECLQ